MKTPESHERRVPEARDERSFAPRLEFSNRRWTVMSARPRLVSFGWAPVTPPATQR